MKIAILISLAAFLCAAPVAQYAHAAPSDWYATMDRNLQDMNALYRSKGDTFTTWTRDGDNLVMTSRMEDRLGATARTDFATSKRQLEESVDREAVRPWRRVD